jgi:uncharacterized protein YjbI with pentapeptide repeats
VLEDYLDKLSAEAGVVSSLLDGEGLDFTGADLSGLDLVEAELSEVILNGARLVDANLAGAWLNGAKLRDADLSRSNLRKAQGRACNAEGAVLLGANLDRCELEKADLRRADTFVRCGLVEPHSPVLICVGGAEPMRVRSGYFTDLAEARLAGSIGQDARGTVRGPIDVGVDAPRPLDGTDLQRWFADHGAPLVEVWQPGE